MTFTFFVSLYKETFRKLRIFYLFFFNSVRLLGLVTLAFQLISSLGGIGGPEKDQVLFSSDTNCFLGGLLAMTLFRGGSSASSSFVVITRRDGLTLSGLGWMSPSCTYLPKVLHRALSCPHHTFHTDQAPPQVTLPFVHVCRWRRPALLLLVWFRSSLGFSICHIVGQHILATCSVGPFLPLL